MSIRYKIENDPNLDTSITCPEYLEFLYAPENYPVCFYSAREGLVARHFPPEFFYDDEMRIRPEKHEAILMSRQFCASLFHYKLTCVCDEKSRLTLSLHCDKSGPHVLKRIKTVKFQLNLETVNQEVIFTNTAEASPDSNGEIKMCDSLPASFFADKHFPNERMIVWVEVLAINGVAPLRTAFDIVHWPVDETTAATTRPNQTNSENFDSILKSGKYSDFTIVVKGGREFKIHKVMLAGQSPVFAQIFDHLSLKEVREGRAEITNLDEDVFEQLLEFVYTGRVDDRSVTDLFIAANKYQMDSLLTYCDHFMRFTLTDDTVADIYNIAHLYKASGLRERCICYITEWLKSPENASLGIEEDSRPMEWWEQKEVDRLEDELVGTFTIVLSRKKIANHKMNLNNNNMSEDED